LENAVTGQLLTTKLCTLLQPRHRPPLKAVITTLVNSLSGLPADVVLVLDDYT
jgi:ATP/maltotriose-dependent transcriptional regulator MalT